MSFLAERVLNLFDHAMIDAGSDDRAIFMFCISYLADYVKKEEYVSDAITVAIQRRV